MATNAAAAAEQAVAIAAAAGTGSLIKNTAPFQQLWPGPKWNQRSGRQGGGAKEAADHREAIRTRPASWIILSGLC